MIYDTPRKKSSKRPSKSKYEPLALLGGDAEKKYLSLVAVDHNQHPYVCQFTIMNHWRPEASMKIVSWQQPLIQSLKIDKKPAAEL